MRAVCMGIIHRMEHMGFDRKSILETVRYIRHNHNKHHN
jgi:hypothetical protein